MKSVYEYIVEWCGNDDIKKYLANIVLQEEKKDVKVIIEDLFSIYKNNVKVELCIPNRNIVNMQGLCINSVKNPQNIGALCPETEFELGKGLNVFYGENGSGKSTYVKIFRKLSENYLTSVKDLSLKSNIYLSNKLGKQSVVISYETGNNKIINEEVDINDYHRELSKINVFDAGSLQPLLNKDLSFTVLPKGLDLFVKLKDLLDTVKRQLIEEEQILERQIANVFQDSKYKNLSEMIGILIDKAKTQDEVRVYLYTVNHEY